ncbi:bifunctional UDP-N-acetylmuramoyl-tripeptide:D-alanyl-D-alanine ligase/alanine racemase [Dyadobacter sediminis]|uniref:Alanine racemase n=1 Tax=Dyadobacter sediminis TaxID=1493691 RepID=A0A5R9KAG7_9BACT|nr:bifunctional UDP-N-acetylmuramoyl-tripeptide:D-alanyl-D-alanine ligase/alanine racemase [Dyadobacter sediminis]TLU91800.1 bifunctional UDP-N-acetylmuramoyl-tripeptide:D-alanyl-D-alanine ligase/alanine racemase [Dyadobacter sediminis]GGC00164.1 bifunctional UDP-N-acetylmuramoyl-tripeptide:D-alanyl-D-alanine ligase/alanine racemase [Dyadobacter sediminis]
MNSIGYNAQTITTSAAYILTDSRQISFPEQSIFFAIRGNRHDGHQFLPYLYASGVREFVVEENAFTEPLRKETEKWSDASIWVVPSSIRALQKLVADKRRNFHIPVVGIAGSNGKTIVKEWLVQLLSPGKRIVSSPKSYNSQIGVPLSVWNMGNEHELAIFEAGISQVHEMEYLQPVMLPTIGIFTNIGSAHDDGFKSRKQKITEKLRLFTKVRKLIYRKDYTAIDEEISLILRPVNSFLQTISWGKPDSGADISVICKPENTGTVISFSGLFGELRFETAFRDDASLENLTHCIIFMLDFGISAPVIQERIQLLKPVSMRLELKEGINHSYLIDDTYNNDIQGLLMALNFLSQQEQRQKKTVILSDVLQTGQTPGELYGTVAKLLKEKSVSHLIGIGKEICSQSALFDVPQKDFYKDTDSFLRDFPFDTLSDSMVLVKGARPFSFERIVHRLQQKAHGTVLEINLDSLSHNLNYYKSKIGQETKVMAMVKAFAYGSGSSEVAALLQYHRLDYLGVAYADEGVSLRQNGITLPIMVMNATMPAFDLLLQYKLEPEIYSRRMLADWIAYVNKNGAQAEIPAVHLKLDTGMHRLGFVKDDYEWLSEQLKQNPAIKVASVFSHLVGADEGVHNEFSRKQFELFMEGALRIEAALGYKTIKHILNSAGIVRFPDYKLDMVRLGIGLYGVEATGQEQHALLPVGTLKTIVSQIKYLSAGETVGYSRKGELKHDAAIATLAIGYADGYDRRLGNGVGHICVNGTLCPTVGNICMDMTMIDVTNASVDEGDEVIVFGKEVPITELAKRIGTIPYEILTGIGDRVKRVFYKE